MVLYLDQNYASRIAKYLIGQAGHAPFGSLYHALRSHEVLVPPSPFHVLETRGGYLLPTLKRFYAECSQGWWLRPWREVVARQAEYGGLELDDLLTTTGSWRQAAKLDPLEDLFELELTGDFLTRCRQVRGTLGERLGVPEQRSRRLPFFLLLSRLLAFRSLDEEREARASDLVDLLMAATVAPYVDALATDRYLRELLQRVGHRGKVFSGRRAEVMALIATITTTITT